MATDHILALLLIERDKLTAAIEALQGPTSTDKTPGPDRKAVPPSVVQDSHPPLTVGPTAPEKRKLSAAGRRAIVAATKKRWAAIKAAKSAAAPVAAILKTPPAKTQAAAKPKTLSAKDAAFRKKMSETMKKAWAARRRRRLRRGNELSIGGTQVRLLSQNNWLLDCPSRYLRFPDRLPP
jgi:hypothetical protein